MTELPRSVLVDDLMEKVAWNDESNPSQGFKYLYLDADDYEKLAPGTVMATEVVIGGEKRYALSDIIGQVNKCVLISVYISEDKEGRAEKGGRGCL